MGEEEGVSVGEEESTDVAGETAEGDIPETAEEEKPAEEPEAEEVPAPADGEPKEETPGVTVEEPPAELKPSEPEEPKELTREDILDKYKKLDGVTDTIAIALYEAGYESMEELREAEEEDLKMVDGIGPKTAESIAKALKEL